MAFNVRASELREVVNIETMTTTADAYGNESDVPATITDGTNVPAKVEPLRGSEFIAAQQVQSEVTHIVKIRHRSGVLPSMRLLYRSRYLQILAVIDMGERQRMLELHCKEMAT